MRTEQLTKYFEPLQKLSARLGPISRVKHPLKLFYITDRSKAILLTLFSLLLVLVSVSLLFSHV